MFDDYTDDELVEIFTRIADGADFTPTDDAVDRAARDPRGRRHATRGSATVGSCATCSSRRSCARRGGSATSSDPDVDQLRELRAEDLVAVPDPVAEDAPADPTATKAAGRHHDQLRDHPAAPSAVADRRAARRSGRSAARASRRVDGSHLRTSAGAAGRCDLGDSGPHARLRRDRDRRQPRVRGGGVPRRLGVPLRSRRGAHQRRAAGAHPEPSAPTS